MEPIANALLGCADNAKLQVQQTQPEKKIQENSDYLAIP